MRSNKQFFRNKKNKTRVRRILYRGFLGLAVFFVCFLFGLVISGGKREKNVESFEPVTYIENTENLKNQEITPQKSPELVQDVQEVNEAAFIEVPQVAAVNKVEKSIDSSYILSQKNVLLAKKLDNLLRTYRPDYAIYLIVDAKTNEILAYGERKNGEIQQKPDFLSRSTFPAASLIKTVTLAAALESSRYSLNTEIPLIGGSHTLYKNQLHPKEGKSYPTISLQDAYASSSNPPMAIVGYKVGAKALKNAAEKLGYNRTFIGNAPNKSSFTPQDSGFALAEAASGFNQQTTLSPLLAAAQIRALLMKRPLEIPHGIGLSPYAPEKAYAISNAKFSDNTYFGVRQAMLRTVTHGTARKNISTRNMARKSYDELYIGGKTGSLDGFDPKGRYEWFAGFAQKKNNPEEALILVIMQVHGDIRSQPATQVAAVIFNFWANNTRKK